MTETISREKQPSFTPETEQTGSELLGAEQQLNAIRESVGGDLEALDTTVAHFTLDAEAHMYDGTPEEIAVAEVAGLEIIGNQSHSTATADALNAMPIDSLGPALEALQAGRGEEAAALVMNTLDAVAHHASPARHEHADSVVDGFMKEHQTDLSDVVLTPHQAETHTIANVSLSEKMARSAEGLQERAEDALERCDYVRSPEIEKAMEGFYGDHRKLQATLEAVTTGLTTEDRQTLESGQHKSGNFVIDSAMERLAAFDTSTPEGRSGQLQTADEIVSKVLFNENAIGATVLEENEIQTIPSLHQKIREQAQKEGLLLGETGLWKDAPQEGGRGLKAGKIRLAEKLQIDSEVESRRDLKDKIASDTRHAGRLEFHNSPFMDEIARGIDGVQFTLTSRSGRVTRGLELRHTTGEAGDLVGGAHSNLVHFSENYTPYHYKIAKRASDPRIPGTLAVPLGDIIDQAPFARDSHYSVETTKLDVELTELSSNDRVYFNGNSGGDERTGEYGNDRVFLADYRDTKQDQAHNYTLKFGTKERASRAKIILTKDDVRRLGDNIIAPFGSGEGYPDTVVVDYDNDDHTQTLEQTQVLDQGLTDTIQQLNRESIARPEYRDKRVVPLRSGVMEFQHENHTPDGNYLRGQNTANRLASSA